jgi:hypothetical protein
VGATSFKYAAAVDVLCDMLYLSGTILSTKEQRVKPDNCKGLQTPTKLITNSTSEGSFLIRNLKLQQTAKICIFTPTNEAAVHF